MGDATNTIQQAGQGRHFTTGYIAEAFKKMLDETDEKLMDFIEKHSTSGTLELSASDSLELQNLMSEQGVAAQTATGAGKDVKDTLMSIMRNV